MLSLRTRPAPVLSEKAASLDGDLARWDTARDLAALHEARA